MPQTREEVAYPRLRLSVTPGSEHRAYRVSNRVGLVGRALVWLFLALLFSATPSRSESIRALWEGVRWDEPASALLARFGRHATVLPWVVDFGDSYTQLVIRSFRIGGYPLVVFFQMDKATGGLKRIQLERQRHGVNPPAFRAVIGALNEEFGAPARVCEIAPAPASGYQAAVEEVWRSGDVLVRAIFRDTTIEAFEGCLAGGPGIAGPCGLTGQLLVRISPNEDGGACPLAGDAPPSAGLG